MNLHENKKLFTDAVLAAAEQLLRFRRIYRKARTTGNRMEHQRKAFGHDRNRV